MLCWRRFRLLWRFQAAFAGLLTFPCLGYVWAALRVVWVGAPRVGAFGWFPFTCGWAVISALCAARERAPPGVWLPGVVALVAYAVSGCPVTVLDVGAVTGFPCTCAICGGVRSLARLRCAVCLSVVSRCVACCLFVVVCFVCRLLRNVRFVSAPARGVTWFMTVCAGARLTATAVVVYCLLCKGRFWQFAEHFLCAWCSR